MRRKLMAGTTGATEPIWVAATNSTTGGGLAGLAFNTAGLVCEYRRSGQSTWTAVTLSAGTLGSPSGSATAGTIVADGADVGSYELGLPDNALVTGARWSVVRLYGAANMLPVRLYYELDAVNYQDATALGLSRLDAAVTTRPTVAQVAAALLSVPGTPLTNDASGRVDVGRFLGTAATLTGGKPDVNTATIGGLAATPLSPPIEANVIQLNGSAQAAANHQAESECMQVATVTAETTPTTTAFSSSDSGLTSQAAAYVSRKVVWRTGANDPGSYLVGNCSGTGTKLFTVASMPFAPAVGDKFIIIT